MNELQALLLGVVQGLTEFLPISSSGHLILVPWVLDFHYLEQHPEFNKTFDVALHLGTLVAVLTYFRRDLMRYAPDVAARFGLHPARVALDEAADELLAAEVGDD